MPTFAAAWLRTAVAAALLTCEALPLQVTVGSETPFSQETALRVRKGLRPRSLRASRLCAVRVWSDAHQWRPICLGPLRFARLVAQPHSESQRSRVRGRSTHHADARSTRSLQPQPIDARCLLPLHPNHRR